MIVAEMRSIGAVSYQRTGARILKVAREVGVGTATVQRVRQEMTGPFADAAA